MEMTPFQLLEEIQKGGKTYNDHDDNDDTVVWNMIQCLSNLSSHHCRINNNHDEILQLCHWMAKFMNLQSSSSSFEKEKEWMKEWKIGLEWIHHHPKIDAHIFIRYVLEMMVMSSSSTSIDDNNDHFLSIYLGMILCCFAIQKQQQKLKTKVTPILLSWKRYIQMIMETIATFQKYYIILPVVAENNNNNNDTTSNRLPLLLFQQLSFTLLDPILQQIIISKTDIVPYELQIKYKWIKEGWIATITQMIPFVYHHNNTIINLYPQQHYHTSSSWWLLSHPSIIHDLLFYRPIRHFYYHNQNNQFNKQNHNNRPDYNDESKVKSHAKELLYRTIHPLTSCDDQSSDILNDIQDSYLMGMSPKLDRLGIALLAHYWISQSFDFLPRVYSPNHLYLLFFPHSITLLTAAGQQESPQQHSTYHQYGIDILTFILHHTPYLHSKSFLPNNTSYSKFFILRETKRMIQNENGTNNKTSIDPLPWSPLPLIQCIFQESLFIQQQQQQQQQSNTTLSFKDHQKIQKLWNVLRNILNVYDASLQVEYLLHLWKHYRNHSSSSSSSSSTLLEDYNPEYMMLPPKILDLMRSPIRMILVVLQRSESNPSIASVDMNNLTVNGGRNNKFEPVIIRNIITDVLRPVFVDLLEKCFPKYTKNDESLASKLLPQMELYVSIMALIQLALHTIKQKTLFEDDSIIPLSLLLENHKEPRNIDNFIVVLTEIYDIIQQHFHTIQQKSNNASHNKDSESDNRNETFRLMLLLHSLEQTIEAASSLK